MKLNLNNRLLLLVAFFSLTVVLTVGVLVLHKDFDRIQFYFKSNAAQLKTANDKLTEVSKDLEKTLLSISEILMESDLSLGLFETPEGTKFVLEKFGVSGPELSFIKKYRGPLIEASEFDSEEDLMGLLRNKIIQHYQANKSLFSEYDLTNREKLIASAVAQVNGSIATNAVKSRHPYKLDDILMIHNGN